MGKFRMWMLGHPMQKTAQKALDVQVKILCMCTKQKNFFVKKPFTGSRFMYIFLLQGMWHHVTKFLLAALGQQNGLCKACWLS